MDIENLIVKDNDQLTTTVDFNPKLGSDRIAEIVDFLRTQKTTGTFSILFNQGGIICIRATAETHAKNELQRDNLRRAVGRK